ncbi:hypothetical protein ACFWZ2_39850 [Streptomyces sp. NPDC059002]|uniref:hypothetical protein n=1 Tax=Streptomyces sp. NPDC059002 TaxID=3346690 RepID=UPI0036CF2410
MDSTLLQEHARAAVRSFITSSRRARLLTLLEEPTARHWEKFRQELAGGFEHSLDERWARPLATGEQNPKAVEQLLRAAGAPESCVVFSDAVTDDGEYALTTGLELVGIAQGVLVSCIPGVLAYHESENTDRYLLHRPPA